MDIVFSFNKDNNEYLVIKNNSQYIPCKMENNIIKYEITNEELSLINYIFNKIKTTDNRIELSNFDYKEKEYKHFYDKTNDYHIFTNLDGSDIDKKIFCELNMLFNYQSEFLYIKSENKDDKLKRLVKLGKQTILVLVTAISLISPLSKLTPVKASQSIEKVYEVNEDGIVVEKNIINDVTEPPIAVLSDEEKIENLKETINNNENLNDEEKRFFLNNFDIIYDNIEYIDYELVNKRFSNVYIEYDKDKCTESNTAAYYSPMYNYIHVYSSTSISEYNKPTVSHEVFHMLQSDKINHPGLFEPLNDILVNEYQGVKERENFKNYAHGYNEIKPYIFTLIEIIGSKPFLEYNFKGDITSIVNELKNIIDDESKIYEMIGYLDAYKNNLIDKNGDKNLNKYLGNKIEKLLSEYYNAKYNLPIEENFEIMINLHKSSILQVIDKEFNYCEVVVDKMYFNSECMNEHIKTKMYSYEEVKNIDNLNFTDSLKYLYNKKIIYKDDYNYLNNLYNLYLNKKITFDYLVEESYFIYGIKIDNPENMKVTFEDISEKVSKDYNYSILKGKSKEIKKAIKNNENNKIKLENCSIDFKNVSNFRLNNIEDMKFENLELIITTNKKQYKISNEYIKKVIKNLYMKLLDEKANNRGFVAQFSIYKNILSINILDKVYNINLKTGKKASLNKLIKITKTSKEEIMIQAKHDINEIIKEFYCGEEIENRELEKIIDLSLEDFINNGIKTASIDYDGNLYFNTLIHFSSNGKYKSEEYSIVIGSPYVFDEEMYKSIKK